jgi:hypothetical protein
MNEVTKSISMLTNTILDLNNKFQQKMNTMENEIHTVRSKLSIIENPDPEIQFSFDRNDNHIPREGIIYQNQMHAEPYRYQTHSGDSRNVSSNSHNLKMKPQPYGGKDDLNDFLTQFEITAEINGWGYNEKSLYLASSLTNEARSLLSELNERERRDFDSLVEKLKTRFGSENKAEVYRIQLKTRVRNKGETIQELAQSIRKMTRQAYPSGSQDVVEALALDNFIDALSDSDIRLRLREVAPQNIFEAEKMAVRMEAHRIADRQRNKLVGHVIGQNDNEKEYNRHEIQSNPRIQPRAQNSSYQNVQETNNPFPRQDRRPFRTQFENRFNRTNENWSQKRPNNQHYNRPPQYNNHSNYRQRAQFNPRPNQNNYNQPKHVQGNFQWSNQRDQGLTNPNGPKLH